MKRLIILLILLMVPTVSGYTADSYTEVISTLSGDYTADAYTEVISILDESTGVTFVVTLNSPDNATSTTDSTPDFNFTVTGTESEYSCELFVDSVGYGIISTEWQGNSNIVSGLGDIGIRSAPNVFYKDSTWYLISGEYNGVFYGFNWTGTEWLSDSAMVSGLGDVGDRATLTTFYKDTTWYLISGENSGIFNGYNWTGSTWQNDTAIISGLVDVGYDSTPNVFYKDTTWYLISGEYYGTFVGYNWTGSIWQNDTEIISGLDAVGHDSTPNTFYKDSTWYLIAGEQLGTFVGYNWTGSTWQNDTAIISGLVDVGQQAAPTVFEKDGNWYLISGEGDGVFYGYKFGAVFNNTATIITANDSISDGTYDWNLNCTANVTTKSSEIRSITIGIYGINCTYGDGITKISYKPIIDIDNPPTEVIPLNVTPVGQTDVIPLFTCINNGTLSGQIQLKINTTAVNVTDICGITNIYGSSIDLTTAYQNIGSSVVVDNSISVWCKRSYVSHSFVIGSFNYNFTII